MAERRWSRPRSLSHRSGRRRASLVRVVAGALVVLAGVAPFLASPTVPVAGAATATGRSNAAPVLAVQPPVQAPVGLGYTVTASPTVDVVGGGAVKVTVKATDPLVDVSSIWARLCRPGVTYADNIGRTFPAADFGQAGPNCPRFPPSTDGDEIAIVDPRGRTQEPDGESFLFHVGKGRTTWDIVAPDGSGTVIGHTELTCDVGVPCSLVVEVSSSGPGRTPGWNPWVFTISYQEDAVTTSCGGVAADAVTGLAPDRLTGLWIANALDLCHRAGQAGVAATMSYPGEAAALQDYSDHKTDVAYSAVGYDSAANLVPLRPELADGGHRRSIAIPFALNATAVAIGNGEMVDGHKVPYHQVKLTAEEAATMFAQGFVPFTGSPLGNAVLARNPELITLTTGAFNGYPAVSSNSETPSWLASRYFATLSPTGWVVGPDKPAKGQARSIDSSFGTASPDYANVLTTLSDTRGAVRRAMRDLPRDQTGGAWLLTDLATVGALAGYAAEDGFPPLLPVQLTNARGEFVAADAQTMTAAAALMRKDEHGMRIADPTIVGGPGDAVQPYPLTQVEYAIVPAAPLLDAACRPRTASQHHLDEWLAQLVNEGQRILPTGFAPLPPDLLDEAKAALAEVGKAPAEPCTPATPPTTVTTATPTPTTVPEDAPTTLDIPRSPVTGAEAVADGGSSFDGGAAPGDETAAPASSSVGSSGPAATAATGAGPTPAPSSSPPTSATPPPTPVLPDALVVPAFAGRRSPNGFVTLGAFLALLSLASVAAGVSSGRLSWRRAWERRPGGGRT